MEFVHVYWFVSIAMVRNPQGAGFVIPAEHVLRCVVSAQPTLLLLLSCLGNNNNDNNNIYIYIHMK